MEPALLEKIVGELRDTLAGGVVSRVHQSNERTVVLRVFCRGADERLLISTHPRFSRMHLTAVRRPNPERPLRFCAFLRSRITNARVEDVTQNPGERIARVHLRVRTDGESGDFVRMTLIAELTGKSANVILVDEQGVVLDSLKHFPAGASVRAVEPGVALDPLPPPPPGAEKAGELIPRLEGESWNEAADRFYSALEANEAETLERSDMGRVIKKALARVERLIRNLEGDRRKAESGLDGYRLGELLITNLHAVKRGMKEVKLPDYTAVPPVEMTVPLDEKLTPKENAERYFKLAKKSKRGLGTVDERATGAAEEAEYLRNLLYEWESAETDADIEAVREELTDGGYIKVKKVERGEAAEGKGPAGERSGVRRYRSSEGFEILCGRSGRDNDMIVQKFAAGEDVWFHAEGVPGSHVIIKVAGRGKDLTRTTIGEAAAVAAWHSKARGGMKVDVIYTEARNVKKPKGSKPGLVTVREHKTIRVKPEELEEL